MSSSHVWVAAAFFASGISFGGGLATLLTVVMLGANRRRTARHTQSQFEQGYLACLADRAAQPIEFPNVKLPATGAFDPDLNVRAMFRKAELVANGTAAKVKQEYAEAATKVVPAVKDSPTTLMPKPLSVARHRTPTESPLVGATMSLAAGTHGWEVAKVDPVTQTDLISLRAIREQGSAQP